MRIIDCSNCAFHSKFCIKPVFKNIYTNIHIYVYTLNKIKSHHLFTYATSCRVDGNPISPPFTSTINLDMKRRDRLTDDWLIELDKLFPTHFWWNRASKNTDTLGIEVWKVSSISVYHSAPIPVSASDRGLLETEKFGWKWNPARKRDHFYHEDFSEVSFSSLPPLPPPKLLLKQAIIPPLLNII